MLIYWTKHCIKLWRKPHYVYLATVISSDNKIKLSFSEIINHVHGYGKWLVEINDLSTLQSEDVIHMNVNAHFSFYCINFLRKAFFHVQQKLLKRQTSCLNKSLVLKWLYGLEQEKIDFCPFREYLVAVSHKVKSFQ